MVSQWDEASMDDKEKHALDERNDGLHSIASQIGHRNGKWSKTHSTHSILSIAEFMVLN